MKKAIALLLVLALCLGATACSSTSSATPSTSATEGTTPPATNAAPADDTPGGEDESSDLIKVGVTLPQLKAEWHAQFAEKLKNLAPQYGIDITVVSGDGDTALQSSQVDNFVEMGMDYIVVCGIGGTGCIDAMSRAVAAGVPVINILNDVTDIPDSYTYCILEDEYTLGNSMAQLASEWIDEMWPDAEDGSIEVAIAGMAHTPDAILRTNGLRSIEEINPKVKIVQEYTCQLTADQTVEMGTFGDLIFTNYPNTKVFLGYAADESTAFNTVALRYGKTQDDFGIFSVDWTDELANQLELYLDGESLIHASAACWVDLEYAVFEFITGNEDYINAVDENRVYYNPIYVVEAEDCADFLAEHPQ